MKFSHAWLREYAALEETPEATAERLTAAGFPVDGIDRPRPDQTDRAVYDIDIFTNRPDCMNHLGLAREAAAIYGLPLRPPDVPPLRGGSPTAAVVSIRIENEELCRRYSARCVLGVVVRESPSWLRERLEEIGQRSINNVVDATNFVLWEMGQPLHPFDLDRLDGKPKQVIVRRAKRGETLRTLDGIDRRLSEEMLVIADARQPIALAGIMGGQASEIGPATRNILLESAWFDPIAVRRAARALGMHTDASHRFERGADPAATLAALDRATALIAEIAGGQPTDPPIDLHPRPETPRRVTIRPARLQRLLGYDPGRESIGRILAPLGFVIEKEGAGSVAVKVPSFRRDVEREVDLIEEVARHRGYGAIPSLLPLLPDDGGGRAPLDTLIGRARAALLSAGLSEAINFVMGDGEQMRLFAPETTPVAIENPLQSQAAALRTTLLPGLLRNLSHNLNHGASSCGLFEIGRVILRPETPSGAPRPEEPRRPAEGCRVAAVFAGDGWPFHWSLPRRETDFHDARGAVELLADRLGISPLRFSSDRIPGDAPVAGLMIAVGGSGIGCLGEVSPIVLRRFEIDRKVFAFELDLEALAGAVTGPRHFRPLPRFPAVRRDLALLAGETVGVDAIERTIRSASPLPIASVQVFDCYRGRGVPAGSASVALQIVFQHPDRTLEAAEVHAAQDAVVAALGEQLGVTLRGTGPS